MPGNTVLADHVDKVPLGIARQRRFAEMRVLAQICRGFDIKVSKIAATAAGHQDFTPRFLAVIQQQNAAPCLSSHGGTKHSRRSGTHYNGIKPFHALSST